MEARLQRLRAPHEQSRDEDIRHILREAVGEQNQHVAKFGSRLRQPLR